MNRRKLLSSVAGLALIAGCSTPGPNPAPSPIPSNILQYIQAIEALFQRLLPSLQSFLPTSVFTQLSSWVSGLANLLNEITAGISAGSNVIGLIGNFAQTVVQVLDVLSSAGVLQLPGTVVSLLNDVETILPPILAFVGAGLPLARRFPMRLHRPLDSQAAYQEIMNYLGG